MDTSSFSLASMHKKPGIWQVHLLLEYKPSVFGSYRDVSFRSDSHCLILFYLLHPNMHTSCSSGAL